MHTEDFGGPTTPVLHPGYKNASDASGQGSWVVVLPPGSTDDDLDKALEHLPAGAKVQFRGKPSAGGLPMAVVRATPQAVTQSLKDKPLPASHTVESCVMWTPLPYIEPEEYTGLAPYMRPIPLGEVEMAPVPWGLDRIDQRHGLDQRYTTPTRLLGSGVHIYIISTGIRSTHADIAGRTVPTLESLGHDVVECEADSTVCAFDHDGHGTRTAAIIGGRAFGVAKDVSLHAVKAFGADGKGNSWWTLAALEWIITKGQSPSVIYLSPAVHMKLVSVDRAVEQAVDKGVVVVVPAGDGGETEDADACFWTPASVHSAITVGATTEVSMLDRDRRAPSSNMGTCVDIFAPGGKIVTAGRLSDEDVNVVSGTAAAAAHAAGGVALLLEESPTLKPKEAGRILVTSGTFNAIDLVGKGSQNILLYTGPKMEPTAPYIDTAIVTPHTKDADADETGRTTWVVVSPNWEGCATEDILRISKNLPTGASYVAGGNPSSGGLCYFAIYASPEQLKAQLEENEVPVGALVETSVPWAVTPTQQSTLPATAGSLPWNLDRIDQRDGLDGHYDTPKTQTGAGVHVYLLDTGIRSSHEDLEGRVVPTLEVLGYGVISSNPKTEDGNGHGTHMAGIVAGKKYGVAKAATLHAVKVFRDSGSGMFWWTIAALDWIMANGKKPGVVLIGGQVMQHLPTLTYAVNSAVATGLTVVVPTGMAVPGAVGGGEACTFSPGQIASALTVGATAWTGKDEAPLYGALGTCVDIFAPGSGIESAGHGSDNSMSVGSGTCLAAAHAAGAAALLLGQDPSQAPLQVGQRLIHSATFGKIQGLHSHPDVPAMDASPNLLLYAGPKLFETGGAGGGGGAGGAGGGGAGGMAGGAGGGGAGGGAMNPGAGGGGGLAGGTGGAGGGGAGGAGGGGLAGGAGGAGGGGAGGAGVGGGGGLPVGKPASVPITAHGSQGKTVWTVTLPHGSSPAAVQALTKALQAPGIEHTYSGHGSPSGLPLLCVTADLPTMEDAVSKGLLPDGAKVEATTQWKVLPPVESEAMAPYPGNVPPAAPEAEQGLPDSLTAPDLWGLDRIDQRFGLNHLYTTPAQLTGKQAEVYLLDTGVRATHKDFENRVLPTLEVLGDGVIVCHFGDKHCAADHHGHGTMAAGVIGGRLYGVAKGVTLRAVKVFGNEGLGETWWFLAALDWVMYHSVKPAVVSASPQGVNKLPAVTFAIDAATASGITVVVPAGDHTTSETPLACSYSPGSVTSAVVVGASKKPDLLGQDQRAAFSNYGMCLDIFAPGVEIMTAGAGSDVDVVRGSGTSIASQFVAGALALLIQESAMQELVATLKTRATFNAIHDAGDQSPKSLLYTGPWNAGGGAEVGGPKDWAVLLPPGSTPEDLEKAVAGLPPGMQGRVVGRPPQGLPLIALVAPEGPLKKLLNDPEKNPLPHGTVVEPGHNWTIVPDIPAPNDTATGGTGGLPGGGAAGGLPGGGGLSGGLSGGLPGLPGGGLPGGGLPVAGAGAGGLPGLPGLPEGLPEGLPSIGGGASTPGSSDGSSAVPWGLDRIDQKTGLNEGYTVPSAMQGSGVHVYIFSTGIRTSHTDFKGRALPTVEVLGVDPQACADGKASSCAGDKNGAGTMAAGVIGGALHGVAKNVTMHAVKVFQDDGTGNTLWFLTALDWVLVHGQRPAIIYLSAQIPITSESVIRAIEDATDAGVMVVVPAGNAGLTTTPFACSYTPSVVGAAVTVGATDKPLPTAPHDFRAPYSNVGSCVDLFAPGSSIPAPTCSSDTALAVGSGTGAAAAHVAGAAALFLGKQPSLAPKALLGTLMNLTTPGTVLNAGIGSPTGILYVGNFGSGGGGGGGPGGGFVDAPGAGGGGGFVPILGGGAGDVPVLVPGSGGLLMPTTNMMDNETYDYMPTYEETMSCSQKDVSWEPLDMPGTEMRRADNVSHCQQRCAHTKGCARFSFWEPQHNCHLSSSTATPQPMRLGFISGPPGCMSGRGSNPETLKILMQQQQSMGNGGNGLGENYCIQHGRSYEPLDPIKMPERAESMVSCQEACAGVPGCDNFVYDEFAKLCHFVQVNVSKEIVVPGDYFLSGPPVCPGAITLEFVVGGLDWDKLEADAAKKQKLMDEIENKIVRRIEQKKGVDIQQQVVQVSMRRNPFNSEFVNVQIRLEPIQGLGLVWILDRLKVVGPHKMERKMSQLFTKLDSLHFFDGLKTDDSVSIVQMNPLLLESEAGAGDSNTMIVKDESHDTAIAAQESPMHGLAWTAVLFGTVLTAVGLLSLWNVRALRRRRHLAPCYHPREAGAWPVEVTDGYQPCSISTPGREGSTHVVSVIDWEDGGADLELQDPMLAVE